MSAPATEKGPTIAGDVRVLLYSRIDRRHEPTGVGWQLLHGEPAPAPAWGVAICESPDGDGFVLYTCEEDWLPVTTTRYATLEEAKCQAEFAYDGLESTWCAPPT